MLHLPATCIRSASHHARTGPVLNWVGETSGSLDIAAPKKALFDAYADVERMPQWSSMLESVVLVDSQTRRSEWALRIPRPLARLVGAVGMGQLVRWEAVHETEGCDVLRWRSLSGVQNSGEATFVERAGGITTVSLRMTYTLPDLAGPLLSAPFAKRFVRRTMMRTMYTFKDTLEAEAVASVVMEGGEHDVKASDPNVEQTAEEV
mmetsp:Transcript_13062/g.33483  ORF Transcript_13062/g.33483 Transcript_13062/m.33483 type:complete len:206 (+) Transcript_13062:106-723(+)